MIRKAIPAYPNLPKFLTFIFFRMNPRVDSNGWYNKNKVTRRAQARDNQPPLEYVRKLAARRISRISDQKTRADLSFADNNLTRAKGITRFK